MSVPTEVTEAFQLSDEEGRFMILGFEGGGRFFRFSKEQDETTAEESETCFTVGGQVLSHKMPLLERDGICVVDITKIMLYIVD